MWHFISEKISEAIESDFICGDIREVHGGDTHQSFKISDGRKRFFVKTNNADAALNFQAEALGLMALSENSHLQVPNFICHGICEDKSYIVLQHILIKEGIPQQWLELGAGLAKMHKTQVSDSYGCEFNNYIGNTPQVNHAMTNWCDFFAENRIGHMLQLLAKSGIRFVDIDAAVEHVKSFLQSHQPRASMLHGDLWRGNIGFYKSQPVIFDPAFYYGDRETDIAMTELFGPFPDSFYQGYQQVWSLASGYESRRPLYQLYHILNHALMFGGNYMQSAKDTLKHISKL